MARKIISSIPRLRDPFVLVEDGKYYVYGTGWVCYKGSALDGEFEPLGVVASIPEDCETDQWAPEVHKYKGSFYMFTTYRSKKTAHRGCTIMKSESPEGPFIEITDGHFTPKAWDSIDATFYVDEKGQPWSIFVHEWTCTEDRIGRMCAVKLSDDLTRAISEPIELFRADSPSWTSSNVTDGCFMHRFADGELIMLWSNFTPNLGYAVGIARSDNKRPDGKWSHDPELLFSRKLDGKYDGGHGMLFTANDGQLYLSIHSPNQPEDGRPNETPVFVPVREEGHTIVWDEK